MRAAEVSGEDGAKVVVGELGLVGIEGDLHLTGVQGDEPCGAIVRAAVEVGGFGGGKGRVIVHGDVNLA